MAKIDQKTIKGDVWFAYDWHCPICTQAARALQIRKTAGALHLVDVRENEAHPWFGKCFAYSGPFNVTEVSCPDAS